MYLALDLTANFGAKSASTSGSNRRYADYCQ
jgi:hypothetical protein